MPNSRILVVLGISCICLLGLTLAQPPPPCAVTCEAQALAQPAYANKTQTQLCSDEGFGQLVGGCVLQECSVIESLSFHNITRTSCGLPSVDQRQYVRSVTLSMFALATVFFSIRILVKYLKYSPWGPDDSWSTVAFVALIPFTVLIQLMIPMGLGLDIWVLPDYQITSFLKYLLITQEMYIFTLAMIKASILAFFLRIFPDEHFRIVVWGTLAFDLLVGLIFMVLSLVQRLPIWLIWEGWKEKEPQGVVLDLNNTALAHGGLNIILDVWMLVLPFTQLYNLKTSYPLRQKLGILAMFSVGIFIMIVGAIRVKELVTFATSRNITSDVREGVTWSCTELAVGIVVACMPHARQLFREASRKIKGTAQSAASTETSNKAYFRARNAFRDDSLETGTAVKSSGSGPACAEKSVFSSMSAYTATSCTSTGNRPHSSFASDAPLRIGSVAQTLDDGNASRFNSTIDAESKG